MSDFLRFTSTKINIFLILLDASGSMENDVESVRKGMNLFKESFNGFYLANSIAVATCRFGDDFYKGEFLPVREMDTRYDAYNECTALNYSIVNSERLLRNYVNKVIKVTGVNKPQVTFVCISDGQPCRDKARTSDGIAAIKRMNDYKWNTAFAAVGTDVDADFGKDLGFKSAVDVTNRKALIQFLAEDLSNSCKQQSQSRTPLGENFFSQANKVSQSNGYSQTSAQVLEDNSWIEEI